MTFSMNVAKVLADNPINKDDQQPTPKELKDLQEIVDSNLNVLLSLEKSSIDSSKEKHDILNVISSFADETTTTLTEKSSEVGKALKVMNHEDTSIPESLKKLRDIVQNLSVDAMVSAEKTQNYDGTFQGYFTPIRNYFKNLQTTIESLIEIISALKEYKRVMQSKVSAFESFYSIHAKLNKKIWLETKLAEMSVDSFEQKFLSSLNEEEPICYFPINELMTSLRLKAKQLSHYLNVSISNTFCFKRIIENDTTVINEADKAELMTINGISNTATLIISSLYREFSRKKETLEFREGFMANGISLVSFEETVVETLSQLNKEFSSDSESLMEIKEIIVRFRKSFDKEA